MAKSILNRELVHLRQRLLPSGKTTLYLDINYNGKSFVDYLSTAYTTGRNKPKKLAAPTAKLYYDTFVTALNQAVRDDYLSANPADKLCKEDKRPILKKGDPRVYLTEEDHSDLC